MTHFILPARAETLPAAAQPTSQRRSWARAAAALATLVIGAAAAPAATAATTGSWTQIASMSTMRDYHAATLLSDGRVLEVGSSNPTFLGHYAEAYNPVTGTWQTLVPEAYSYFDQTVTELANGKVLIVGGRVGSVGFSRAQLLDVTTGALVDTGSMNVLRFNHAALRLADGRVFVAGGEGDSRGLGFGSGSTSEIYDPATTTWTKVAAMNTNRARPTAALLPDGRVLVVGSPSSSTAGTAEVYDPAANTWTPTGALPNNTGGVNHAMTVLADGSVLSVGGSRATDGYTDRRALRPVHQPVAGGGADGQRPCLPHRQSAEGRSGARGRRRECERQLDQRDLHTLHQYLDCWTDPKPTPRSAHGGHDGRRPGSGCRHHVGHRH
jgi:hypothetical protein